MRFFSIFALILFGLLSPAFAACDEEVRDALGKFWQSGPFYYVSQKWNINFMRQMAGKIAPGNIEHRTLQVYDGIEAGEEILIGNKSWRDDGLGWMGPHFASWSHDVGIPKDFQFFQFIENASCAGDVEIAGSIYRKFNYKPGSFSKLSTAKEEKHTIYVDPANGLIARYERTSKNESFIKMVSTFRFDNSIRIKPPAVDLQGRKEKSIRVFNEVVEKSDPNCRNSVSDIINTAQNHYPFEYEIIGSLWSGVSRISGKFVPPYSISYYIHGVPYHGGDSEIVLINKAGWSRRKGEDWSELANGLRDYNNSAPVGRTLPHLLERFTY
ncbi:MAG: hypothetical protein GY748_18155 [Planctomycetaceae bacterium]|nr:hypothetical protein [Planctomycetaceae bacterium]